MDKYCGMREVKAYEIPENTRVGALYAAKYNAINACKTPGDAVIVQNTADKIIEKIQKEDMKNE